MFMRGLNNDANKWNNPDFKDSKRTAMYALRAAAVVGMVDLVYVTTEIVTDNVARGVKIAGLGAAAIVASAVIADRIIGHNDNPTEVAETAKILEFRNQTSVQTPIDAA